MISLFNMPNLKIETNNFDHLLHGSIVSQFEEKFCEYVGAKYACSVNSATNAIFLTFLNKNTTISIPSMIPPVVCNALLTSGNNIKFIDDNEWIGNSYILHKFTDWKVIDSAQKVERDQFKNEAEDNDVMIFSFYPTKPIGSCDGGIIVSNDYEKIKWFKEASLNGMTFATNNWDRTIKFPGYKMYLNSIQAYIAFENLKSLDDKQNKIDQIRKRYNDTLGLNNLSKHLYRLEVENRYEFVKALSDSGIQTGIHYKALHLNPIYQNQKIKSALPRSEKASESTVSIPFNETLTLKEQDLVLKSIEKYAIRN